MGRAGSRQLGVLLLCVVQLAASGSQIRPEDWSNGADRARDSTCSRASSRLRRDRTPWIVAVPGRGQSPRVASARALILGAYGDRREAAVRRRCSGSHRSLQIGSLCRPIAIGSRDLRGSLGEPVRLAARQWLPFGLTSSTCGTKSADRGRARAPRLFPLHQLVGAGLILPPSSAVGGEAGPRDSPRQKAAVDVAGNPAVLPLPSPRSCLPVAPLHRLLPGDGGAKPLMRDVDARPTATGERGGRAARAGAPLRIWRVRTLLAVLS